LENPIYEINALKHAYAGKTVLDINHLSIQKASIIGLVGPNGSGKSTLLRLLGLIEKPTEGRILFENCPVAPFSEKARFLISLLPQEPFLMKRSVYKNIAYGLKLRGNVNHIQSRVTEALSTVGLTYDDYAQRPWYALSGGEMQRVALASRLALKPKVLLLDEPTASVDALSAQLIKDASIKERKKSSTTLIIASHDWQWLFEVCDKIFHLFQGKIYGSGRETFIYGPWHQLETNQWGKILSDGQIIYVTEPPDHNATAVINELSIDTSVSTCCGKYIVLKGIISRLSLERNSGDVFATILVGDIPFTLKISPHRDTMHAFFPGNRIYLKYHLEQIKWI